MFVTVSFYVFVSPFTVPVDEKFPVAAGNVQRPVSPRLEHTSTLPPGAMDRSLSVMGGTKRWLPWRCTTYIRHFRAR